MAKDRHERDRIADEGYEVEVVAKLMGLTRFQVFRLIEKYGRERANLLWKAEVIKLSTWTKHHRPHSEATAGAPGPSS